MPKGIGYGPGAKKKVRDKARDVLRRHRKKRKRSRMDAILSS